MHAKAFASGGTASKKPAVCGGAGRSFVEWLSAEDAA
eukprot:COSAG01_NODE_43277_length_431_cov_1.093373_1_plen_36_part_01